MKTRYPFNRMELAGSLGDIGTLLPLSVLGVLLLFAGSQLALTILDMGHRRDFFVTLLILGITLASNLAVGFLAGIAVAYALKWDSLRI